jgi:hypothetical protein
MPGWYEVLQYQRQETWNKELRYICVTPSFSKENEVNIMYTINKILVFGFIAKDIIWNTVDIPGTKGKIRVHWRELISGWDIYRVTE